MADSNQGKNQGQQDNSRNFAKDPQKASEAGRKGGKSQSSGGSQSSSSEDMGNK